jgi:hypothetical protein
MQCISAQETFSKWSDFLLMRHLGVMTQKKPVYRIARDEWMAYGNPASCTCRCGQPIAAVQAGSRQDQGQKPRPIPAIAGIAL